MLNSIFIKSIEKLSIYKDLLLAVQRKESPVSVTGVSGIHKAQLVLGIYDYSPILIITEDESSARRICDDINEMSGGICGYVYPAKDFSFTAAESISREYEYARIGILSHIADNSCRFICASAEAVLQKTLPPDILKKRTIELEAGTSADLAALMADLIAAGYSRCDKVEGASQFSVRGAIIDIFPV